MRTLRRGTLTQEQKSAISDRKQAARQLEADAERAARLASEVADMNRDLARLERRREKYLAVGDGRVEFPQKLYHQGIGAEIEIEPLRSRATGIQLAKAEEPGIAHVRGEIARLESEIKRLLAE